MFAYCNNNPICFSDPTGRILTIEMFDYAVLGDGEELYFEEESEMSKALKKSTALLKEFKKNIEKFIASGATLSGGYWGTFSTYEGDSFTDKDLSLSVGSARYLMSISKETRTTGFLWWRKEESRYVADVLVWDVYDFTEWRTDDSFGSIMNNIAYIGQSMGLIVPYYWQAKFTLTTKWG